MTQATMTPVRVQTPGGQQINLNSVRSLQLQDGWHNARDCQITYKVNGEQKSVPFSSIQGFSDQNELEGSNQS